jgi:predicted permease
MDVAPDSPLTRQQRMAWVNVVAPRWFETIGIRLVAGRDIDARDTAGAPAVAVVNRAFAARFLPGVDPVGARFFTQEPVAEGRRGYQVVGLVEDSVYRSVRDAAAPTMYLPLAQEAADAVMTVVVRPAAAPSEALSRSLAAAIEREDRDAILTFRTLDDQIAATLTQERVLATVAVFLGGLGLLLAAVGLYGVTSQAVSARRAEIGIRMALGASARGVVRMVIGGVAVLVAAGIAIGAALSAWASTYVRTLLYGLEPHDPSTFAAAAALLALVAALAAWLPARRASRIDPMQALRR